MLIMRLFLRRTVNYMFKRRPLMDPDIVVTTCTMFLYQQCISYQIALSLSVAVLLADQAECKLHRRIIE